MSRGYDVVLWIDSYDVISASYLRHTSQCLVDSAHEAQQETHPSGAVLLLNLLFSKNKVKYYSYVHTNKVL